MKLFCHIGMPHTAAGYIQSSLAANQIWLQGQGIAYGEALATGPCHDTLYVACTMSIPDKAARYGIESPQDQAVFRKRLAQHLLRESSALPDNIDRTILSCEDLYGKLRHPNAIAALHELLTKQFEEVELILYVRRQDDAILAAYCEAVRLGRTSATLEEYAEGCMMGDRDKTLYVFYKRALEPWIDTWGRSSITLRRYSSVDFINGDLLHDFLGVVLGTWEPDMTGFHATQSGRKRVSAPALEYLRRLNKSLEVHAPGIRSGPSRPALFHQLEDLELPTSPRPIMPAALSRKIMAHYSNANQWLRATFTPETADAFFPDRLDHPEFGNLEQLSVDEAVSLSGRVLTSLALNQEQV